MLLKLNGSPVEYHTSFSTLSGRYDAFLVDIWGDGSTPYPGAADCLRRLNKLGKRVILVSNAARRAKTLVQDLERFGIASSCYEEIVSSGETVWRAFKEGTNGALKGLGKHYYLLGTERNELTEGLDLVRTTDLSKADFVFNKGMAGNPTITTGELEVLERAVDRNLIMICANPDLQVVRAGVTGLAAGALAERYERLGGKVIYFGKPHPLVYQRCFEILDGVNPKRIAAVGDGLHTDVAGAHASGIDSVLVGTGIHADSLRDLPYHTDSFLAACEKENQYPTCIVKAFSW